MQAPAPPLVSIVVPSWNQGRFLRQCLLSLLAQDYPRLEIHVRDNLSDDGTADVLREFAPRLTSVVRERDRGQADALRRGFQSARGEILGWLNADDMLMPHAVASAVGAFAADPKADVVYAHCAFLDDRGQFLRYFDDIQEYSAHELRNYSDFIAQPSTFFRREAYEAVGGIDPTLEFAMDWDLWCRLAHAQRRFVMLDRVLSGARLYRGTKTASGGLRRMAEVTRVNWRHKTTLLPMVPVLFLAHLHSLWLKPAIGPLHWPLQRLWRALTGRRGGHKAVVNGLRPPRRVVDHNFKLELPVYERLGKARLSMAGLGSNGSAACVTALLNGRGHDAEHELGSGHRVLEWHLGGDEPVNAVTVECRADSVPESLDIGFQLVTTPVSALDVVRPRSLPLPQRVPVA